MSTATPQQVKEVLSLLHDIDKRVVRLETLVVENLEKDGTLERLSDRVDGMNTRALLLSGATSGAIQLAKFLLLK